MLKNTFCHVPGIGPKSEYGLWKKGFLSWEDVIREDFVKSCSKNHYFLRQRIEESLNHLAQGNPNYFARSLSSSLQWRFFQDFRSSTAYLDIETTGMGGSGNSITTIALYDGASIFYYVHGDNLNKFKKDIANYKVLVTYNGRCFDVPVIQNYFGIRLDQAHIDLRFVLKSLGYTGGLKGCEKSMGLDREDLDGLDGYAAVLLWDDFKANRNEKALETLLAYNILDAVNLEHLMVMAYNLKLKDTPFAQLHSLDLPTLAQNPFKPHQKTVSRIKSLQWGYYE
jgi:uncharacterized protein